MKRFFFISLSLLFFSASAQQKEMFDVNRHISKLLKKKQLSLNNARSPDKNTFSFNKNKEPHAKLSHITSKGDKVYILKGDNMPCVVPGNLQSNLPNVSDPRNYYDSPIFKNDTPGLIPNAVKPYRIIALK